MPQSRRRAIWQNFVRSDYITSFTDWFLRLAGNLAEFVLYTTVLYTSAELYPGVSLPDSLNLAVFIIQMGALDIGGIGLSKLADQAKEDGNSAGAETAEKLSQWLIRIMIAGIVTVSLEVVVSHIPGIEAAKSYLQVLQTAIEMVLAVARAICAVLYGKVVHKLKRSHERTRLPVPQADLQEVFKEALADLIEKQEQRLTLVDLEQKRMLTLLHEMQSSTPEIDYERVVKGLIAQFETQFRGPMRHLETEMGQQVQASQSAETLQIETRKAVSKTIGSLPTPQSAKQRKLSHEGTLETTITHLLDQNKSYTVRELARFVGTSTATAGRIRKTYFEKLGQAVRANDETEKALPDKTDEAEENIV